MIQVVYNMIFLLNQSNLHFKNLFRDGPDNFNKIYRLKTGPAAAFCSIGPKSVCLTPLLEEVYSYKFDERPNYKKLRTMMEQMLVNLSESPMKKFSWAQAFDSKSEDYRHCLSDDDWEVPNSDKEESICNDVEKYTKYT